MLCVSRCTRKNLAQTFGNNRNLFYIEFRCNVECQPGTDVCGSCISKNTVSPQTSRRYDHGKVTGSIPAKSHIYGSEWYLAKVKKYGEPSADVVAMAEEARPKPVIVPVKKSSPQVSPRTIQTVIHMTTTPQKNKIMTIVKPIIKPGKKPIVIAEKPPAVIAEKPVVIAEKPSAVIIPKKKPVANRKPSVFSQIKSEPHKDVIIPTYMESTMEVVDVDDYEVEYVKLSVCEINGSTYFKSESQKIYKKLKDNKIGEYMGRYEANTSCIHTDIPDSDDEDES